MSRGGRRAERVAGLLRMHLTELLRELGDPRLTTVVITDVEVSDDLAVAKVRVRSLLTDLDGVGRKALLRSLGAAAGRLRRGLGPRLDLRKLPELRFEHDVGHDNVRRVDEILREIQQEKGDGASDES